MVKRKVDEGLRINDPLTTKKRRLKIKVYDNPWKAAKGEGETKYITILQDSEESVLSSSQKLCSSGQCSISPTWLEVNQLSKKTGVSKLELVNLQSKSPVESVDFMKRKNTENVTLVSLDSQCAIQNNVSNTPNMNVFSEASESKSENTPSEGANASNGNTSLLKYDPDTEHTRDSCGSWHFRRKTNRIQKELLINRPQDFRHFVCPGSVKKTPAQSNCPHVSTTHTSATLSSDELTQLTPLDQPVAKTTMKDINERLMAGRLMVAQKRSKWDQKRVQSSTPKPRVSGRVLLAEPPVNYFLRSDEDEKSKSKSNKGQREPKPEYGSSILLKSYKVLRTIGSGEFGTVHKVVSRYDGCVYAIKKLSKLSIPLRRRVREMLCMSAIKSQGSCDNLVEYFCGWTEDNIVYIRMEYCERGSLEALSSTSPPFAFTNVVIRKILRHIASGLAHMHSIHFVHMDVKPGNILLSNDWKFKLCDFGHSIKLDEENARPLQTVRDGDKRYISSEVLKENYSDLCKSDIYSLGASVYDLARVQKALPIERWEWIDLRKGKFVPVKGYPDDLNKLFKSCLTFMPAERPSAETLFKTLGEAAVKEAQQSLNQESQKLESMLKVKDKELEKLKIRNIKLEKKNKALQDNFDELVQKCKQFANKEQFNLCKSFNLR